MPQVVPRALLAGLCLSLAIPAVTHAQAVIRGGGASGFTTNSIPRNDDGSTGLVNLGFTANFFGTSYTQAYVNNNGNITFNAPLVTYTPFNLTGSTGVPIIAAYFADVDTRNTASALVQYGIGTVDGHAAFGINSDGVGYYNTQADKLNVFQEILIDRSDTGMGNFDIEFNYDHVLWETGSASGGSNGFGGTPAAVGYSAGTGIVGSFAQLSGSFTSLALLDGGPAATSLIHNSQGSAVLGRYIFNVRNGSVIVPPPVTTTAPEPATVALVGAGVLALGGVAGRRRRPA